MDRSNIYHGADQNSNASQGMDMYKMMCLYPDIFGADTNSNVSQYRNIHMMMNLYPNIFAVDQNSNASQGMGKYMMMYLYPNIFAAQYKLALWLHEYEKQVYEQQQFYGHDEPADPDVPYPQWSVCGVKISHQSPMTYVIRTRTDGLADSIFQKIDMILSAYTGAEKMPPKSRGPKRTHAFRQCIQEHARVQSIYIEDAEKCGAFACYAGLSEEELSKEPYRSMPEVGIPLSPPMTIHGLVRFVGVDLVLTDCKQPGSKESEATGFYTSVSELEGDCAGARVLRLLTDNEAFAKLDIINLNITEKFCAGDKSRSLDLYRSAGFSVRAKHVNIKIRWGDIPFDAYEMDFYPELKRIICPQLREEDISEVGTWQMAYST